MRASSGRSPENHGPRKSRLRAERIRPVTSLPSRRTRVTQLRWFSPVKMSSSRSGAASRNAAIIFCMVSGILQSPAHFTGLCRCSASVMIPEGLVKLIKSVRAKPLHIGSQLQGQRICRSAAASRRVPWSPGPQFHRAAGAVHLSPGWPIRRRGTG